MRAGGLSVACRPARGFAHAGQIRRAEPEVARRPARARCRPLPAESQRFRQTRRSTPGLARDHAPGSVLMPGCGRAPNLGHGAVHAQACPARQRANGTAEIGPAVELPPPMPESASTLRKAAPAAIPPSCASSSPSRHPSQSSRDRPVCRPHVERRREVRHRVSGDKSGLRRHI